MFSMDYILTYGKLKKKKKRWLSTGDNDLGVES